LLIASPGPDRKEGQDGGADGREPVFPVAEYGGERGAEPGCAVVEAAVQPEVDLAGDQFDLYIHHGVHLPQCEVCERRDIVRRRARCRYG